MPAWFPVAHVLNRQRRRRRACDSRWTGYDMTGVRALSYLGVRGPNLDEWRSFATDVLGLQIAEASTPDRLVLRMDDRSYRLTVVQGEPGLDHLGFELASRDDLDELAERMRAAGVGIAEDGELALVRQVEYLMRCQDPAGNNIEFVAGHVDATTPFVSPRGVTFKTGTQGVGHAVIIVPDFDPVWAFYVDLLGFRVSDTIDLRFTTATFLHCNARHHTLAIAAAPGITALGHFMLEVDDLSHVGRAYDIVTDRQIPISMSLGMHTNDHMVSFYVKSPSGFDIEYGTGGREVDDATWTVSHYDEASYWGHRRSAGPRR